MNMKMMRINPKVLNEMWVNMKDAIEKLEIKWRQMLPKSKLLTLMEHSTKDHKFRRNLKTVLTKRTFTILNFLIEDPSEDTALMLISEIELEMSKENNTVNDSSDIQKVANNNIVSKTS
jgi:hypothetical protein